MRSQRLPLEGQVERTRAEESNEEGQHRVGAEPGAVNGPEARVFVDRERELERFPE